VIYV
jgi:glycoprotein-N-acetylgalactosamine 3-beta-galactosyltransferase